MFSLFVKPSELQRWDRYGCSYSRFLNKYYHKAHSSYALLQRHHRVLLGAASLAAPESCWPHKPMGWQQWSLPDVCGAAALLLPRLMLGRGCSAPVPQLQPGAGTHGLELCHVCRVIRGFSRNVEGTPGQLWVCFTVGNSHRGRKRRVLNDCGRKREKRSGKSLSM